MRKKSGQEQIEVWQLNGLPGLELRSGIAVTDPYPRHWHEEYQFCFIQAGGGELFYRGIHHNTPQASLFIIHPGEVHSNQTQIGCSFRSLYVSPELMQIVLADQNGCDDSLPFFRNPMVFDNEIASVYQSLHEAKESTVLEQESILLEMLSKLARRYSQQPTWTRVSERESKVVARIRDYIVEHHARNISLRELSHLAGLSQFHFTRVFSNEVGMPPHAFQTQVRIATAKRLLKSGMPLVNVATTTGFSDQSHFIRQFKRLMKVTPGQYLRNSKNVQYTISAIS
jgi:AraC-like DNA-binding protein